METGILFPNLHPEIFRISIFGFGFALRWYALAYIVGILIGWRIAVAALRRAVLWRDGKAPMVPEQFENLLTWIVIGIIGGGRLGYVLFYKPAYYVANPTEIPIIWEGGMSFHGGFLGVVLAIFFYARRHAIPLGSAADLVALASPIALLLGRLANFVNAELWGRQTDLPWGVIFPAEPGVGAQSCATIVGDVLVRCARHPSQLYEAFLEGIVLMIVLWAVAFRAGGLKRPWLVSGLFFLGYGLARFAVEFVRQPDAHFQTPDNPLGLALQVGGYGLTMGQLLTLPMIAAGLWAIAHARRTRPA